MELLLLVWRQYRWPFISVIALSLLSAALGLGLIAFINLRLMTVVDTSLAVLPEFLGLLLLLMVVTLGSQLALTTLGHHFVFACAANLSNASLIAKSKRSRRSVALRCSPV